MPGWQPRCAVRHQRRARSGGPVSESDEMSNPPFPPSSSHASRSAPSGLSSSADKAPWFAGSARWVQAGLRPDWCGDRIGPRPGHDLPFPSGCRSPPMPLLRTAYMHSLERVGARGACARSGVSFLHLSHPSVTRRDAAAPGRIDGMIRDCLWRCRRSATRFLRFQGGSIPLLRLFEGLHRKSRITFCHAFAPARHSPA